MRLEGKVALITGGARGQGIGRNFYLSTVVQTNAATTFGDFFFCACAIGCAITSAIAAASIYWDCAISSAINLACRG